MRRARAISRGVSTKTARSIYFPTRWDVKTAKRLFFYIVALAGLPYMIKNVGAILKVELEELPHHDTINSCFKLLKLSELEQIIKKMANALIRRNTFNDS